MDHLHHLNHGMNFSDMGKLMEKNIRNRFFWSLAFTIPVLIFSYTKILNPIFKNWILLILATPIVLWFGSIFPLGAFKVLKNKTLDMTVLITVGVFAAYFFSVFITIFTGGETFFEAAAMLVTFVLFGHWMEMKSRRGTHDALKSLLNLVPPQARVFRNNKELIIPTSEVILGDIIILKPGDKIPVDGEIIEGETSIDESLVTGESIPVSKKVGDLVIGASINQTGSIKFKATKIGADMALAQIIKLVETAQNSKAPGQRLADKAAQYLVIIAVGSGILTFTIWFFIIHQNILFALTFAVSAVVIACPDALGLATPTAVAVGIGLGAKHNFLIKDAVTLEQISKINTVVMDKTGTLTEGRPEVTDIISVKNFSENKILNYIAAVEKLSNHPLSKAVLDEASKRKLNFFSDVKKFRDISGYGIEAIIDNKKIIVGSIKLIKDQNIKINFLESSIQKLLDDGKTLIFLAIENKIAGVIGVIDPIKKTSLETIKKLKELGIETVLVTGDNQKTAETVGKNLGIDQIFAEVLPKDKANYIEKLQKKGKFIAFVGDGVNDAPALAQADIGIAIGAGTDVAIETADIVLMKSDPLDILKSIILSKATVRKMKENLIWASVYNLLAIPIAAGIFYPKFGITLRPEFSAILMSLSSIIVAINAISLKRVEKYLV